MNNRHLYTLTQRSIVTLASRYYPKLYNNNIRPSIMQFSSNIAPTDTEHVKHRKKSRIPFVNWFYNDIMKGRVKVNSFFLYAGITKQVNYIEFFKIVPMDDTFNSWFLITELHVWMLMVSNHRPNRYIGNLVFLVKLNADEAPK